jgi:predicted nucleic acid-binding protein
VAVICDTGAVYALYDADDQHHDACKGFIEREPGPLFLPVVLLAEIDYLLTARLGSKASSDFLESVEAAAFTLIPLLIEDVIRCRELTAQYHDLPLGLADATVVAAAERLQLRRIFTVDQRHFRVVRSHELGSFIILPADE